MFGGGAVMVVGDTVRVAVVDSGAMYFVIEGVIVTLRNAKNIKQTNIFLCDMRHRTLLKSE